MVVLPHVCGYVGAWVCEFLFHIPCEAKSSARRWHYDDKHVAITIIPTYSHTHSLTYGLVDTLHFHIFHSTFDSTRAMVDRQHRIKILIPASGKIDNEYGVF